MSLFNSIVRGFGFTVGSSAARSVMSSGIDRTWKFMWGIVKWTMIIAFLMGVLQGIFGK